jgi:two-component system LytT family response regulator
MAEDRRVGDRDIGELAVGQAAPESAGEARPRRLLVRNGARVVVVDIETIDWIEASGDYVRIHAGARAHLVSERMHALETLLDAGSFLRVHRSVIVNLGRVRELSRDADGGGSVVLHDGVRLRVARSRWDVLVTALGAV